jgi:hypothetical protein
MRARQLLPLAALVVAGCSVASAPPAWTFDPAVASPIPASTIVEVYKSPTCSCCHEWEAYLRAHGYTVRSIPTEDMPKVKRDNGLPGDVWSCHTAVVAGYAIEGHVPVAAIDRLLAERPAIDGIALPGMPAGSPGMPGVKDGPFGILAIDDGATGAFGSY